ncbi:MAG: O-antigen ligase family protein, partial [Pyrinomonadaceae bacterium]|nr:O-antigen ligase family protein [Pyrinomonadaceae bacterium]
LDYWNAFGALAALGAVLAGGLAADPRQRVLFRAIAAGLAVPLATAMYLSLSRGSWLALAAGLAVLVVLSANRWSLLLTFALVGGLVAIAVILLRDYPALVDDPSAGAGQAAEGRSYGRTLLALTIVAVVAQGVLAAGHASHGLMVGLRRVVRPILLATVALAVLAVVGVYVAETDAVEEESAERLASIEGFFEEQWDEFMQPGAVEAGGTERLTTARGTRSDLYRVAIDGFEEHPLRGDGSGGFQPRFALDREVEEEVRDAHSLYLETLGELGLVGFLLLALFIGSLAAAAVRARLRPTSMSRSQAAAVTAACAVWVAHAGVDWDWQMPALTAVFFVLAASLYPEGRRPARRLRRPLARGMAPDALQRRRTGAVR